MPFKQESVSRNGSDWRVTFRKTMLGLGEMRGVNPEEKRLCRSKLSVFGSETGKFNTMGSVRDWTAKSTRTALRKLGMPLLYNVGHKDQYVTVSETPDLNPSKAITIEAVCGLHENGQDPTVLARPFGGGWESPYVVYRLGFYGTTRVPEFQLLFESDTSLTTIRGDRPVELERATHLAGTYDGKWMRLYVDGALVASLQKPGTLATSNQPTVFAARSSTELGGMFVGTLAEFRIWNVARSIEEINLWKRRLLPVQPSPDGLVSLWPGEPGPSDEIHDDMIASGFSFREVSLLHWAHWYAFQYFQHANDFLEENAFACYSAEIRLLMFVRAKEGYLAFYCPDYSEDLAKIMGIMPTPGSIQIATLDQHDETVSEVIQSWTDNRLKVVAPRVGDAVEEAWTPPPDVPEASDVMISPAVRDDGVTLPQLTVSAIAETEQGKIKRLCPGRIHAISPVVQTSDGSIVRQFTWLFADFWFGELTREVLHLPTTVHLLMAELQVLQWTVDFALPPQEVISDGSKNAVATVRQLLEDFEHLLDKPGIDEVADIQPFLADAKNWILLSPSRKHVWPQKMLGNKWKVDFLVRESDDSYTAVEIESPNFPLFTKQLDPHYKLTHAEQQVRDYCEYIDQNRDTVEREEGLTGIFRPRGTVVIGRRKALSDDAMRKLIARNRDAGRYTVMVYDDLIDRVRSVVSSIEAAMPS